MEDTSTKKMKNQDNRVEDIKNMEPQMHDAKTMLEEIKMETSSREIIEGLDKGEVEEKTLF